MSRSMCCAMALHSIVEILSLAHALSVPTRSVSPLSIAFLSARVRMSPPSSSAPPLPLTTVCSPRGEGPEAPILKVSSKGTCENEEVGMKLLLECSTPPRGILILLMLVGSCADLKGAAGFLF